MQKLFKQILILIVLIAFLVLPYFVFAEEEYMANVLKGVGTGAGYNTGVDHTTPSAIVGTVINAVLGLLGVIFTGLIIYGGFVWMNARGNEDEVKKSLDTIKMALVGLVIVLGAYVVWNYVWINFVTS